MNRPPNALIEETSPYLLQHAHNPVEWYPWGPAALDKARREDKPILLSIGYSACHWCHVMAHESFEDATTAEVMNRLFVNIKVDREERPDLDKIYQTAHQLLTQRGGGWPLTVILAPATHVPFFAGTYFPKSARYGLPGFKDLLDQIASHYQNHRDDIDAQNREVLRFFDRIDARSSSAATPLTAQPLDAARRQLEQHYDADHGGFGGAPKFPHTTNLDRLLRHWAMSRQRGSNDDGALSMATTTLKRMAHGGLYDQLGSGFYRYSVDERWVIPHFEKMLYDNGPLLALYAIAWQITSEPLFKRVATETAQWLIREMQATEGGYYSTLDADSESEEGKYYLWQRDDIRSLLDEDEYALLSDYFGLDLAPNFEGAWHLNVANTLDDIARRHGTTVADVGNRIGAARTKLFTARQQRTKPGRDEKILTAWNGLAIKGMAAAGRYLQRDDFIESAIKALTFIKSHLWREGRLLTGYKDGRAPLRAYLDDYAFLLDGILELLQHRWNDEDAQFAVSLAETLLAQFEDESKGGFFFTANDHEKLIYRPKIFSDEALPAGNGIAAHGLIRLGHMLGETRYLDAAERCLHTAWHDLNETPFAHNALLTALEEFLYPPQLVVLRGDPERMRTWQERCATPYQPRRMIVAITDDGHALPGANDNIAENTVIAYRCDGFACSASMSDLDQFIAELDAKEATQTLKT